MQVTGVVIPRERYEDDKSRSEIVIQAIVQAFYQLIKEEQDF
jgi:hypothetical protein